jgi:TolC family type I secretion outer membrane protein
MPPLPPGAPSPVPAGQPLALKEAIDIALKHQPQVSLSIGSLEAAAGRTREAESGYLPSFNVNSQYSNSGPGQTTTGRSSSSYSSSISGSQLLYDFGRTPAEVARARAQQRSATQALGQTRQDVVNSVKQAYYNMLLNEGLVGVQRRNVSDQQAHLAQAQARVDIGLAPPADVVRAEAAVAEAVFSLATAQNAAANARIGLNLAMGIDVRTPTQVQDTEEPRPALPDVSALVAQALANRPTMKQARFDLRVTEESLRLARMGHLPSLFADGSYGWSGADFPPTNRSYSYGVSLQWPIFDSGLTSGRIKEAEGSLMIARANLRQNEQAVSQEVTQAYLALQTAEQQVAVSKVEVANAEENLRVVTGQYQAGVAMVTYINVIDAETALLTANTNQVNARQSLSTARAALELALGLEEGQ